MRCIYQVGPCLIEQILMWLCGNIGASAFETYDHVTMHLYQLLLHEIRPRKAATEITIGVLHEETQ